MDLNHALEVQKKARRAAGVLSVVAFLGSYASATPVTFTGEDIVEVGDAGRIGSGFGGTHQEPALKRALSASNRSLPEIS